MSGSTLYRIIFFFYAIENISSNFCDLSTETSTLDCSAKSLTTIENINLTSHTTASLIILNLNLSINNLSSIESSNFTWLPNIRYLETLNLSNNQIIFICEKTFNAFKHLRELILGNNRISALHSNVFSDLESLEHLDISGNKLESIDYIWLKSMPNLYRFNCRSNRLQILESALLADSKNLHYVDFGQNMIDDLPSNLVGLKTDIVLLDLSYNRLKYINNDLSMDLRYTKLNLTGNLMDCTCMLIALRQLLVWNSDNSPKCATPKRHEGKFFYQLYGRELLCDHKSLLDFKYDVFDKGHSHYLPEGEASEYDPLIGFGTAFCLFGMLVLLLICMMLDNAKRKWKRRRSEKKRALLPPITTTESSGKSRSPSSVPRQVSISTTSGGGGPSRINSWNRHSASKNISPKPIYGDALDAWINNKIIGSISSYSVLPTDEHQSYLSPNSTPNRGSVSFELPRQSTIS